MYIVYQYLCSTENIMIKETKDKDLAAPTVCINEGSGIVAGSLSISRQPEIIEDVTFNAAGEFDFNDCNITELSHIKLADIGSNTHAQIDSHIAGHNHITADITDFTTAVNTNTDVSTNTTHRGLTNNPHTVTKSQIGLGDIQNILDNLAGTVAPTVNNDNTEGYSVGSKWIDTVAQETYRCLDTSTGAAIWVLDLTAVDAQNASETTTTSTTSITYVDLDTTTLTTSNTRSTDYHITFSATADLSVPDESMTFIINVDGIDVPETERNLDIRHNGTKINISSNWLAENISNGKIVKIRYKTSSGTLNVYSRVLTIYGTY